MSDNKTYKKVKSTLGKLAIGALGVGIGLLAANMYAKDDNKS